MSSEYSNDIFSLFRAPKPWIVDTSNLKKGIDNYHVDVKISSRFNTALKRLITSLLDEATSSATGKPVNNFREFDALKSVWLDIMTGLIHRIKTDLSVDEIHLLEFALVKQVPELVRAQLDALINSEKTRASEFRERGSTEALDANHRAVSMQRNYDSILFKVNRQIFIEMQRIDARHSAALREKFLSTPDGNSIDDALFSPMLFTSNLSSPTFLIEQYRLWDSEGDERADIAFNKLNLELEQLLEKELPEFPMLKLQAAQETGAPELYDCLGGLLQTQKFMGIAVNQKARIREEFCWFDNPENIRGLFSMEHYPAMLLAVRKQDGFKAWWRLRKQTRRLKKVLQQTAKRLHQLGLLKPLIASHQVAKIWNTSLADRIDAKVLCQYFSGQINIKKLLDRCSKKPLSELQVKQLVKAAEEVDRQTGGDAAQQAFLILEDVSRFRQHLKQYRFAHRAFNRLKVLKQVDEINLSKQSGSLYTLLTANEREDNDARIAHHAILKADVRGSTTVTEELQNRGLNPASYFSLRFFSPVNKMLPTYSATKVFIEGDAVILSFLEYEQAPQQWFSVARACGLAKEMLSIIHANNRYSEQMDLPPLELGIGICYAQTAPRYLYDDDEPIMISSAIGLADRLSSCARKLRENVAASPFNVDVFFPAEGPDSSGEKLIRNLNGILLDNAAFEKLQSEIALQQLQLTVNNKLTVFYTGKFPDTEGKSHDLLIREGHIGLWQDSSAAISPASEQCYYEVITNHKLITEALGRH